MNNADWIKDLIRANNIHQFYISIAWLKKRSEVLKKHNYECQYCKVKGIYKKATTVHHEKEVKKFPHLALSIVDDEGNIHLKAVCDQCHYDIHHKKHQFINEERW